MDVSDRRMQVQLTQEAKIVSEFSFFKAFFAFAGFVSALRPSEIIPISEGLRMLTKSTDCQSLRKPARQGSESAKKGAYHYVSDRILQATLTM